MSHRDVVEIVVTDMPRHCQHAEYHTIVHRDHGLHEASRRLLSVLLREIDGFDMSKRTVVIGATNRKQDLDAALLSR